MNLLEEIKNEFGENPSRSTKIYSLCMKLEDAENKLSSLSEEQKKLFNQFIDLEGERKSLETDEAIEFGFNYAKNMFQALIGIKKD